MLLKRKGLWAAGWGLGARSTCVGRLAASRARFLPFVPLWVGMAWSMDPFQHGANDWKSHDRQADGRGCANSEFTIQRGDMMYQGYATCS